MYKIIVLISKVPYWLNCLSEHPCFKAGTCILKLIQMYKGIIKLAKLIRANAKPLLLYIWYSALYTLQSYMYDARFFIDKLRDKTKKAVVSIVKHIKRVLVKCMFEIGLYVGIEYVSTKTAKNLERH